jgi:hypothetical protein
MAVSLFQVKNQNSKVYLKDLTFVVKKGSWVFYNFNVCTFAAWRFSCLATFHWFA